MRRGTRKASAALAAGLLVQGCALAPRPAPPPRRPQAGPPAQFMPYDMRGYYRPSTDHLGVTFGGAPRSTADVNAFSVKLAGFAGDVGHHPSIVKMFLGWGEPFPVEAVTAVRKAGALPFLAWEPDKSSLAEIADGAADGYAASVAGQLRDLNAPVLLSFAHEMNGTWYPWGNRKPSEFVRAWRRLHQVFLDQGAVSVLWIWSPNIINATRWLRIRPYYPGDAHVDWIGLNGFYRRQSGRTFRKVFEPTLRELRKFTGKPVLLAETAVDKGPGKPKAITDLLHHVATDPRIIGLVWFNLDKESDWRVESSPQALEAFRRGVAEFTG
ncbi:hypothetical protein GCM10027589_08110 [Actinocorallia lasiicapitis]